MLYKKINWKLVTVSFIKSIKCINKHLYFHYNHYYTASGSQRWLLFKPDSLFYLFHMTLDTNLRTQTDFKLFHYELNSHQTSTVWQKCVTTHPYPLITVHKVPSTPLISSGNFCALEQQQHCFPTWDAQNGWVDLRRNIRSVRGQHT